MKFRSLTQLILTIVLASALVLTFSLLLANFLITKNELTDLKVDAVKDVVNSAYGIIENIYNMEKSGQITHEEAIKLIKKYVGSMKFEGSNYVFIFDKNYVGIVHPTLEGKKLIM